VFRSVNLVTKKLTILDFFIKDRTFFLPYEFKINIFLTKNPLNYYSLKVAKFHCSSVKNESARTKKIQGWGGVAVWRLGLKYFFLNGSNWKERRQI